MNSIKRQNDRILKKELPRSVGAQYDTEDQWRNSSKKNEEMEPKQKQHPFVDMTGDGSKVRCCKAKYCIGTWNVRSMNQGKLGMVQLHFEKDFRPRIHLLSNFTLFTAFFFLAYPDCYVALGLLLLSRFSRVLLCATPETAAHQAPPSLGFSRQEHWSGLPFPSPMHESEK